MSAAFLTDFVRRFGCTTNLRSGREFTSRGEASERGQACSTCGECDRGYGEVGIAAEGVSIVSDIDGLSLRWACPGCRRETKEATALFSTSAQAAEILADPLCFSCRKKGAAGPADALAASSTFTGEPMFTCRRCKKPVRSGEAYHSVAEMHWDCRQSLVTGLLSKDLKLKREDPPTRNRQDACINMVLREPALHWGIDG